MMRFLRIGTLASYMLRQNLFLVFVCLGAGTGIYLLSDVFDRLDDFIKAGVGVNTILFYFAVKIPVIFSQILPAVFLISIVVQLGLMIRSRELMALRAGGISSGWFVRFFVVYAIFWSFGQLLFSQYIGVYGGYEANRIWKEEVRKKQLDELKIKNIWFRDGAYIVHAAEAHPNRSRATDLTIYEFATDSRRLLRIITAKKALVDQHGWGLLDIQELDVRTFKTVNRSSQFLSVRQSLKAFSHIENREDRAQLSMWELSKVITKLEESGSNVERLRTAWHAKWSYAFSLVVMALLGIALTTISLSIYANIGFSLVLVFAHYGLHVIGISAGQKGILPPFMAAWLANFLMGGVASLRLAWILSPRFEEAVRDAWAIVTEPLKKLTA